jgi:hypothetical protein
MKIKRAKFLFLFLIVFFYYRQQITVLHDIAKSRKSCRHEGDSAYLSVLPSIISDARFSLRNDSPNV